MAAPPQAWNAFGATTSQLASLYPGQFVGVEIVGGSHVDSMVGGHPLIDLALQLMTQFSPPGNTAAVYTLADGWINDIYTPGAGPATPVYGIYGPTGPYVPPGGQLITLGQAARDRAAGVARSGDPVNLSGLATSQMAQTFPSRTVIGGDTRRHLPVPVRPGKARRVGAQFAVDQRQLIRR